MARQKRSGVLTRPSSSLSVVILTFNEERNLSRCLESVVGWAEAVYVVDSGSTDATQRIAEQYGARIVSHPFETHTRQWAWALAELPIRTDWVMGLDADQHVTPELARAIAAALDDPASDRLHGFFLCRRQVFRGRWIRHGGYYPKYLLKLFRRDHVRLDDQDLVDHHFHISGPTALLTGDLVEDNRNEAAIAEWTAKHNRYAVLQARHEIASLTANASVGLSALFADPDARTRWLKQTWMRLPLYVRPCLYVFYRYILRLGFLDGKEGFIFHVLQAFWYRLLVDINIDELRTRNVPIPERQRVADRS